ncbi:ImmA/IrrE family metallo-endopeptidase [Leuconostoc lactis]|uniref:ImmA/IrrE family metallo-endopeptidase n=1 Tax=Leuconostoc lactis TaxID=1246 RepID=UPI0031E3BE66
MLNDLHHYLKINHIANDLAKNISDYFSLNLTQIRWWHVTAFFEQKYNVIIEPLDSNKFNKLIKNNAGIYGTTVTDSKISIIIFNDTTIKSRQNFTILHEIAHIKLHKSNKIESYTSLKYNNNYSKEDKIKEDEANSLAGQLLINDTSLITYINNNLTFKEICQEFEISHQALKTRIKQHIVISIIQNNLITKNPKKYIKNPHSYAAKILNRYLKGERIYIRYLIPNFPT